MPGPRSELWRAVPLRPGVWGVMKAAGLNHRSALGFATLGLPILSARKLFRSASTFGALETCGVNGRPDSTVVMPLKFQPPSNRLSAAPESPCHRRPRPKGNSQTYPAVKAWVRSKLAGPWSCHQFRLFENTPPVSVLAIAFAYV